MSRLKHIKPYQLFEASASASALTQEQISWLDKCTIGSWKLNSSTGLVDVKGIFDCGGQGLRDFKGVKFGKVGGDFSCPNNQLTSLVGAPQSVWYFYCHNNQLTSLEGAPKTVDGDFNCENNQLTSLGGAPKTVDGDFNCEGNPVSESTLENIFALMRKGKSYQQALEEHWPKMADEDRALMYKQIPNLPLEDERKYKALATYANIKDYL